MAATTGNRLVMLAAGGTGGHLFPAQALAVALIGQGVRVVLATDMRVSGHVRDFPAEAVHEIAAATPSRRSPAEMARAAAILAKGVFAARRLMKGSAAPACVVGFGGYPSVPAVLAAWTAGVPTIIHEQNAVIGRANRFLSPRVTAIATGFARVGGLAGGLDAKVAHVGNPVRPPVVAAAATPYPPFPPDAALRLLVFGGSQGARVLSGVVPAALARLDAAQRRRLLVTQQARPEDVAEVAAAYAAAGIAAEVAPFFADLPQRMAASHLVVARSGASTIAELAVIGRPAILVPLPGALDQDQAANAATLADIGAATLIRQADFTPERLAAEIARRLDAPDELAAAARAAKSAGIADAAGRLAALVMMVAGLSPQEETVA